MNYSQDNVKKSIESIHPNWQRESVESIIQNHVTWEEFASGIANGMGIVDVLCEHFCKRNSIDLTAKKRLDECEIEDGFFACL